MTTSLVLILPAATQTDGDAVAVALGHADGPGTYSVPLSATGAEPAMHYGCRTWARTEFVAMVGIATSGNVPDGTHPDIASVALGMRSQYPAMCAALIHDARNTESPFQHWIDVLAANGLQRIESGIQ